MLDAKYMGMEGLPVKMPQGLLRGARQQGGLGLDPRPIDRITQERMPDRRQVHPDLVGAPGLQPAFDEARHELAVDAPVALPYLPVGDCLPAVRADGHLVA